MARKVFPTGAVRRCEHSALPAGSALAIAATRVDALTYRIEVTDSDTPALVVTVPMTYRIGVLVNGETRWVEVDSNRAGDIWRAVDVVVEEAQR
jgi:hypothetical protein